MGSSQAVSRLSNHLPFYVFFYPLFQTAGIVSLALVIPFPNILISWTLFSKNPADYVCSIATSVFFCSVKQLIVKKCVFFPALEARPPQSIACALVRNGAAPPRRQPQVDIAFCTNCALLFDVREKLCSVGLSARVVFRTANKCCNRIIWFVVCWYASFSTRLTSHRRAGGLGRCSRESMWILQKLPRHANVTIVCLDVFSRWDPRASQSIAVSGPATGQFPPRNF